MALFCARQKFLASVCPTPRYITMPISLAHDALHGVIEMCLMQPGRNGEQAECQLNFFYIFKR